MQADEQRSWWAKWHRLVIFLIITATIGGWIGYKFGGDQTHILDGVIFGPLVGIFLCVLADTLGSMPRSDDPRI